MCGFRVKFESKEQFINGLKALKEIDALGKYICIGTYLPDSVNVNEIINDKKSLYVDNPSYDDDIMEFSIGTASEYIVENYKPIIGKNNICVGLSTYYDCVLNNDVYNRTVSYDEMINETLKLMNNT